MLTYNPLTVVGGIEHMDDRNPVLIPNSILII